MKILTGELKGRKIQYRPHPNLRPSSDKLRKAIFDSLQGQVEGKSVLDLFSGTGALGLEALSSGAAQAVFVEEDKYAAGRIEANIKALGLEVRADVLCAEALKTVRFFSEKKETYDLIFLDPPYRKGLVWKTLKELERSPIWNPGTLVVAECESREVLPATWGKFECIRDKTYGDARLLFYAVKKR